ncbi:MAG TPA: DUF177 domain-containing protein [Fimbriimonadaceae bacterium]|nr:DUF177 domain-containing protein [Fimbriimonadaceae bacterium]
MRRDELLDLNDVLQHPGRKVAVDISTELPQEADVDLLTPLEGYLEAVSTGNLLLLKGEFSTRAVVECARCGGPLEVDVKFDVDEQFPVEGVPSSFSSQDYARVKPEEPFQLFEGNSLMPEALIRQGLIVNMPMQALCQYGWEGPCPVAEQRGELSGPDQGGRPEFGKLSNLLEPEEDAT